MRHALTALVLGTTALTSVTAHAVPRRARRTYAARERTERAEAPPPDDVSTRRLRMLDAFARSGHVRRCWMQQLQRDPNTAARTLSVRLDVSDAGRPRAITVNDPRAPALARCLVAGAWSLPPVGPGEAFTAEGTLHLDRAE